MRAEKINALSDEEINEMIGNLEYREADYCGNAGDMMPVAFDYGISMIIDEWGNCFAGIAKNDISGLTIEKEFYHKNPLRAVAIAYLKIKGAL